MLSNAFRHPKMTSDFRLFFQSTVKHYCCCCFQPTKKSIGNSSWDFSHDHAAETKLMRLPLGVDVARFHHQLHCLYHEEEEEEEPLLHFFFFSSLIFKYERMKSALNHSFFKTHYSAKADLIIYCRVVACSSIVPMQFLASRKSGRETPISREDTLKHQQES